ncbi:MAG: tape measure protein [Comamonas sp.]
MADQNKIDFTVRITEEGVDKLAAGLERINEQATDVSKAGEAAGAGVDKLAAAADKAGVELEQLAAAQDKADEQSDELKASSSAAAEEVADLGQQADKAGTELEQLATAEDKAQQQSDELKTSSSSAAQEVADLGQQADKAGTELAQLASAGEKAQASGEQLSDSANQADKNVSDLGKSSGTAAVELEQLVQQLDRQTAEIKAGLELQRSEIELQNRRLGMQRAEQQELIKSAQARGNEAQAQQAQVRLREIESEQLRLIAQAKRAEAQAVDQAVQARRAELAAQGPINAAAAKEIAAAENHARALRTEAAAADQAAQRVRQLGTEQRNTSGSTDQLSGRISALTQLLGAMAASLAAAFSFRTLVSAAADMEQLRAGLEAVWQDAKRAGQDLEFVRSVVARSGADVREAGKAWLGLAAATRGTAVEGEPTRRVFESVAISMGKAGKSSAETANALLALQQMASKGVIQMEELRGQLGEALPGALQATAKGLGLTTKQLIDLVESGSLTASDFFPALAKGLDELYGTANKGAQTLTQEIGNLKNSVTEMGNSIGEAGGLQALKTTAEIAQAAIVTLDIAIVAAGKSIGSVFAAIATWDFSGLKQSFADIETEAKDKLLKAAQHNSLLRDSLNESGRAALDAAIKQQEAAKSSTAQSNAAKEAAGSYAKLSAEYSVNRKEIADQVELAGKEVEAVKARGEARVAEVKLLGDEKALRSAVGAAAADEATALRDLADKRQTEVNILKAELESKKYLLSFEATVTDERKKEIKALEDLIAKKQVETDKTTAQAAAAEAYAKSKSKEVQAAELATEAAKASNIARLSEAQSAVSLLETQKGLASQSEQIAALMGNEVGVRRAKITQLEIDIKLTKAKAEVARAEAEGSIAVANATLAELRAKGENTAVKEAEIAASIRSAQAKLAEADAIRKSAEITDRELTNLRNGAGNASNGISKSMDGARESVEGVGAAAREAAGGFDLMGQSAEAAGNKASRTAGTSTGNRQGIIEWLKGAGLDEAVAEYISRDFVDANGKVAYMGNAGQKKWNGDTMSNALSNAVDYYKYGEGKNAAENIAAQDKAQKDAKDQARANKTQATTAPANPSSSSGGVSAGATYVSNINIPGQATVSLNYLDAGSQLRGDELIRQLATGKGVAQ